MFVDMLWEWYQENGSNKNDELNTNSNEKNTPQ